MLLGLLLIVLVALFLGGECASFVVLLIGCWFVVYDCCSLRLGGVVFVLCSLTMLGGYVRRFLGWLILMWCCLAVGWIVVVCFIVCIG